MLLFAPRELPIWNSTGLLIRRSVVEITPGTATFISANFD